MKKAILVVLGLVSTFFLETAIAQVRTGLKSNIGVQPQWGPAGYDDHVKYYYLPDIDVFYRVSKREYIYQERGRWKFAKSLPFQFHDFDLYRAYKGVINEKKPYKNAQMYRIKYASFKGNREQKIIRNSRDSRYFVSKDHPQHNKWIKDNSRRDKDNRVRH
jgi:hypothetical protein